MSFSLSNLTAGVQRGVAVLAAVQQLGPILGALVQSAENLFPAAGSGAQKLAHVLDIVKTALALGGAALADVEGAIPVVIVAVNNIVAAAKGQAPAPVAPTAP